MPTPPNHPARGSSPDEALASSVTARDVEQAHARIAPRIHRTPALTSRRLNELTGAYVFCKAENFQRIGSFKFRGATNALIRLDEAARKAGVLTYSSGNHAQAIALAAANEQVPATIVMPSDAPRVKLEATRSYLAKAPDQSRVVVYDRNETTREALGAELAEKHGLTIIPPYDHPHVIAGQGTTALEILADTPEPLDRLYVCCGGGGLLAGCATITRHLNPDCEIIGVEPHAADDATRSFESGVLHTVTNPDTIADGARTPYLGRYTFPMIRERVHRMMTVTDEELIDVMRFTMSAMKVVIEPTGALALAGLLKDHRSNPDAVDGKSIGIILSGGNIDLSELAKLLS